MCNVLTVDRYESEDQAAFLVFLEHSLQKGGEGLADVWTLAPRSMTVSNLISNMQLALPQAENSPAFISDPLADTDPGFRVSIDDIRGQLLRMLTNPTHTPRRMSLITSTEPTSTFRTARSLSQQFALPLSAASPK